MIQISYEQIRDSLTIEALFEPIREAFIAYDSPALIGVPVSLLHFPNKADTHIKTAALDGYKYFSIKVVSMFPENVKRELSPYSGAIFLFDSTTGYPAAILNDKGIITDLRTAAAGALITDFVAPKSASSVAVIGTEIQAYNQVVALQKRRPIDRLTIYGRNAEHAHALKTKFEKRFPEIRIKGIDRLEQTIKESEIILTTTPSTTPLIQGKWLQKGQHVTAIGSDDVYKNEIDRECFEVADAIFIDSLDLNKKYGEFSHALQAIPKLLDKTIAFGTAFKQTETTNQENRITVAKLVGVGIQDLAASQVILDTLQNTD